MIGQSSLMIQVKRTVITTVNRVIPGLIDESSITSNENIKNKFDAVLSKNLTEIERNIKNVPLNTMSTSLTTLDKFLASYSFFHTQTKTLVKKKKKKIKKKNFFF